MTIFDFIAYGLLAVILVYAMVLHEVAHAWVAFRCGDDTAYRQGRITLNPVAHVDPIGTIVVPLVLFWLAGAPFGWAKPVPVNPLRYRHMKRDDILVSMAGIVMNLLFAFGLALLLGLPLLVKDLSPPEDSAGRTVAILLPFSERWVPPPESLSGWVLYWGILVNVLLAIFNLIPIPPLDGSHVVKQLLPRKLSAEYERLGFFGIVLLIALFQLVPQVRVALWRALSFVAGSFLEVTFIIRGLFGG